jgi:hypothetical protein
VLDLSRTVSYNAATGALTVHFFLTDEDGDGIDVTKMPYEMRVYVSELVPTIAGDTDNPGPAWNQLIAERGTPTVPGSEMPGTLTLLDAATGEYNYVCATPMAASTNVNRVTVRARFRFRDNNNQYIVVANPVNASYDFLQANPGAALASSGADMVTTAACESCHGARIGNVGHGGGYTQVKTCNHCHNVNYLAARGEPLEADFAFLIHRIHDAGVFPELGEDFSEVTYPQHIYNCAKCHNGPEAGLAFSNPTRSNCGSCHDDVDFATGAGHAAGAQANDASCAFCHPAASIQGVYHNPAPDPVNVPEFDVTMNITPPANGQFYQEGEAPLVTVTLADHATGAPVDPAVYTTPMDAAGVVGGGLRVASLYVYGPRAEARPVLTTAAVTPNADGLYGQSNNLFVGTQLEVIGDGVGDDDRNCEAGETCIVDPLIETDATGFKYRLMAVPAGMTPGTYMVRVRIGDYGRVGTGNYHIESLAFTNIQIGTATVEPKLSGDACMDCHGTGTAEFHDERHAVVFDTDECLSCHDYSGNHADPLSNRIHAVHAATATGDLLNRDWTEVTYPRPANNCITCHTNTSVDTPVWRSPDAVACAGCHGSDPTATDHPEEAAAALHMLQNGGDFDPLTPAFPNTCLVCHGEGRVADLFETHELIRFRELPEDPNE